jgi:hypothetical protein
MSMTRRLLMLALVAAVAISGAVLSAEAPTRADSCYGGCSMQVPAGWGNCGWEMNHGFLTWVCHSGNVWISTNCVKAGADGPCFCPYEGQGLPLNNGCPDPKP